MSLPLYSKISLKNVIYNAKKVKSLLNKKTKLCAVVKSNAYGHGLVEVASALYCYADVFAVSLLSEAISLRIAGIDKPILMLTPTFKESVNKLLKYDITMSISSIKELKLIEKEAKKLNVKAKVQFAINSGMNRLGFDLLKEVNNAYKFVKKSNNLKLTGAFSHFCTPKNKEFTKLQFEKFNYLIKDLKKYSKNLDFHISSSAGLLLDEKYQMSMVRIGLLLYGYAPIKNNKIKVKPAMQVFAKKISCRKSLKGKNILYGENSTLVNNATLLRLGYADGFLRQGVEGSINNMCMDISAVEGEIKSDWVKVFSNAELLCKKWNTIPYEVLVKVSNRAEKIYIN